MREFNKIFHIGINRTGSKSLCKALRILGILGIHHKGWGLKRINPELGIKRSGQWWFTDEEIKLLVKNGKNPLKELDLDSEFDAFIDFPFLHYDFLEKITPLYLNSLFIFLEVDFEDYWMRRVNRYFVYRDDRLQFPMHRQYDRYIKKYKTVDEFIKTKDTFKNYFNERMEFTNKFMLKHSKEDILKLNILGGDEWDKLCNFLEVDIPEVPFPHIGEHKKHKDLGLYFE